MGWENAITITKLTRFLSSRKLIVPLLQTAYCVDVLANPGEAKTWLYRMGRINHNNREKKKAHIY